ncbi:FAD-dependent oxidoreductase [Fodinicola feengrottensis]|uniref:FAD-dependent oxidoreductase n=1 Tax=Fodinicola feengrottensis TaxID=435914 RepID=UPI0024413F12|nr:FAD-dependent monooxygenase [Fodinicola feengrottensis]
MLSEVAGELTVVRSEPLNGGAGGVRAGRQVDRPLLRAVLLHGLEDAVRFGAPFTRFETRANGTVRVYFGDGSVDTADALIGADGVGSAVRRQLLPQVRVIDTGKRMLMGAAPLATVADTVLLTRIGDNATSAQVRGRIVVLGVLRFTEPPVTARDRWLPDLHAAAVTGAEDYVMWAMPVTPDQLGSADSPHSVWHRARSLARGLPAPLLDVIDGAWPHATVALRIGMIPPTPAWPAGPVTVIGDAIHAAPGFGGNLAMRDAYRLRDALARTARGQEDLVAAIGAVEHDMRSDNHAVKPVSAAQHRSASHSRWHE